jgi:hypothetical protein
MICRQSLRVDFEPNADLQARLEVDGSKAEWLV